MRKACKEVCKQCPFRRSSLPGYLGESSYDPEGFLLPYYNSRMAGLAEELPMNCHMKINWEDKIKKEMGLERAPLCRGLLIFMKNSCKLPINKEIQKALDTVEQDTVNIFQWPAEFVEHHKDKRNDTP